MTWRIDRTDCDPWRFYDVYANDGEAATIKWRAHGENAELHHEIIGPVLSSIKASKLAYEVVKADMRAEGVRLIVTGSPKADDKMRRYWSMMGFRFFTEQHGVPCAVMEV